MSNCSITALIAAGALAVAFPGWSFRADDEARRQNDAVVSAAFSAAARPQAVRAPAAGQKAALNSRTDIVVQWDLKTGAPASLRGAGLAESLTAGKGSVSGAQRGYEQDAIALLARFAAVYRIRNPGQEFAVERVDADELGFHHVRLSQIAGGLRVLGGGLIVHFDRDGRPYQVNGRYIPDAFVDTTAILDAATAATAARNDLAAIAGWSGRVSGTPELIVYAQDHPPTPAYEMTLVPADTPGGADCWRYYIDAQTGEVLNCFNDVHRQSARSDALITGSLNAGEGGATVSIIGELNKYYYLRYNPRHWEIYDYLNRRTARNSAADWPATTSGRSEISAGYNFDLVQSYYTDVHNRNSYDDDGARALANVHVTGDTDNAGWSPSRQAFYFYPGHIWGELTVLDVCGHEFTHAVTEHTAGLIYQYESGALNESFSDIFGTIMEFYYQPDGRGAYPARSAGRADWLIGEDCTYPEVVALRDLRNPQRYLDPSRYHGTHWYYGSGDNGGVHYNCGVQNHFFYLFSDGGNGTNDGISYDVTGIGIENTRRVAYRALTVYCIPSTDYRAARIAWLSAAQDLNPAWTTSVQAAWSAVGVENSSPPSSNLRALGLNNDYDGDQCGDFALYDTANGNWFIWSSLNGNWLAEGVAFGSDAYLPLPGDYNGGGQSDAMVYAPDTACWNVFYLENGATATMTGFGGGAFIPAPGDYDGDGFTDSALYDSSSGAWYVLSTRTGGRLVWGGIFGASGAFPVPGDYDGDGRSDFALYAPATGEWLIFTSADGDIVRGCLGGLHYAPVPGDYDGDGVSDFALYDCHTGDWYIYSLANGWIMNGYRWGGSDYIPVPGDYDGDGISDLVVYSRVRAEWLVRYHSGVTRRLTNFGGINLVPVVYWPLYWYM